MADYINNAATEDAYASKLSLGPDFDADTLTITVANNPALMQLAVGKPGDWRWIDEREFLVTPQSFSINRVVGARFRSAQAGQPARILAILGGPADPEIGAGLPFTGTLSASGAVSQAVVIPTVTLAAFPPANPQDGQACLLVLPASYDPVGAEPVRWICTYNAATGMWDVAGPPLYAEVLTAEVNSNAGYGDLATVGPSITLPRAGDYGLECGHEDGQADATLMAYAGAGIAASDDDSTPNQGRYREHVGLTPAGSVVTAKYRYNAPGFTCANRWLKATPIRIS